MLSVQLVAPRTLEPVEVPLPPEPGPGEALVRVRAVGICGSDLHWYQEGRIGWTPAVYPQVLGHEPTGEVAALGPGVNGLRVGQRVALEPAITCGHCELCVSGRHNDCYTSIFMGGPQAPGFLREYVTLPAHNAVPIPDGISFVQGTVIEPLAVIVHICELVEIRAGDTVAVLGAGPIGMLCAAVARLAGASHVFIADRVAHRLPLALRMGAGTAIDSTRASVSDAIMDGTRARGVDIVLDATGAPEMINAGIAAARPGGKVVLVGLPSELNPQIDLHTAMNRELNIQTIKRSNHNARTAIPMLASGRVSDALVTHVLPLERTPAGFEMLASYADGTGKIVIGIP